MTTFSEILPATKSSKHSGIHWTPATGRLTVSTGRNVTEYRVAEFPADGGRGFRFTKLTPGTDRDAESYDVFVADPRTADAGFAHDGCDCKGFTRHGHCKHVAAVRAILENAYLWERTEPESVPTPEEALDEVCRNLGLNPARFEVLSPVVRHW